MALRWRRLGWLLVASACGSPTGPREGVGAPSVAIVATTARTIPPPSPSSPMTSSPVVSATPTAPAPRTKTPSAAELSIPQFEDERTCSSGLCNAALALDVQGRPAKLWAHSISAGATLAFARDDVLSVTVVVLKGALEDAVGADEPKTGFVDENGKPLPDDPLEALDGVAYKGGGFTLKAIEDSRVLVAVMLSRAATTWVASGKRWTARPGGYLDTLERFDLRGPMLSWADGGFAGVIGLEDRTEAASVFDVRTPEKGQSPPAAPTAAHPREVQRRPDTSVTLLSIGAGRSVPAHQHDDAWEHLAILTGEGELSLGAGSDGPKTLAVRPGSLISIPKGMPHAYTQKGTSATTALQFYSPPGPEQRFRKLSSTP